MRDTFNPAENFNKTKERIDYSPRKETKPEKYEALGFISGLEVHQQLKTAKKLFCHCPAGVFQKKGCYDAEIVRHMRPTLSEMGGYDGTALMEFKTRKKIVYHIANETTCTYDIDDTPPFKVNQEALEIALEIALILKTNIVGELHITRKQYLDGSIPTGFQRTGIISIEGQIPLKNKTVRIIQLSMEEDSCREVSDIGHERVYTTDRLGMPLIETVTYPDMKTPDEVAEAAHYIRFLARSTGKVRTGIGAAREDVNVSIKGGTRVEIKGVSHISLIPELVHNEAFRQKSLLEIKDILNSKILDSKMWKINHAVVDIKSLGNITGAAGEAADKGYALVAVNLPEFKGILSFFTQPERMFADEISDRLKVIACIEKPNMTHSEDFRYEGRPDFEYIRTLLGAKEDDAQILFWGPQDDVKTALDTIEERCLMAFSGVPNETRKSLLNGTTIFERVLPGADRMYPDTDSAPISISQERIDNIQKRLPIEVDKRMVQLGSWNVPKDAYRYLLRNNLLPLIERISKDFGAEPKFIATLLAHRLKYIEGQHHMDKPFDYERIYKLFAFAKSKDIKKELILKMLPIVYSHPEMEMDSVFEMAAPGEQAKDKILSLIPALHEKYTGRRTSKCPDAELRWMMKQLREMAVGNISLKELAEAIKKGGLK